MTEQKMMTIPVQAGVKQIIKEFDNFFEITPEHAKKIMQGSNKYDRFRAMVDFDSEIASGITRIAGVVGKVYDTPKMKEGGNEKLLEDVTDILDEMRFSRLLQFLTTSLARDGDVVLNPGKVAGKSPLEEDLDDALDPLPLNILTITDRKYYHASNRTKGNYVIRGRDNYILNEGDPWKVNTKQKLKGEHMLHISLGNKGNWSYDIKNRATYGVWGKSPLESLQTMVLWKYQSIRDDAAWRHTNVPRFDHSIPLDAILDINQYEGTMEQRIQKAHATAQKVIDQYKSSMMRLTPHGEEVMDVDEGFIHDSNTVVQQIGGNNTYADCMPIVQKVDMSIATKLGIPLSAFGYEEGSTYAIGKVTVNFMNTFGLNLLNSIQDGVFDFVKRVLRDRNGGVDPYSNKDWGKIFLNYNISDFDELRNLIEAWSISYKSGLSRLGESRDGIGLGPIEEGEIDSPDPNKQFHPNVISSYNYEGALENKNNPFTEIAQNSAPPESGLQNGGGANDKGGDPALASLFAKTPEEQLNDIMESLKLQGSVKHNVNTQPTLQRKIKTLASKI